MSGRQISTSVNSPQMTQTGSTSSHFWDNAWKYDIQRVVPTLDAPTWNNQIDVRKMQFLQPYLPISGVAVEVGCGSARLLARIGRSSELSLIGVDLAPNALTLALRAAETFDIKMDVVNADVHGLSFETNTVDIMLSGGLLEHFPDPRPVLAEMLRVLHVDGVFYADVVPRKGSVYRLRELPRIWVSEWLRPGVYESTFGPKEYAAWLTELGCTDIRIEYCGVYPKLIRWLPARIRRRVGSLLQKLDGTAVADALGWYFIIVARKGSRAVNSDR